MYSMALMTSAGMTSTRALGALVVLVIVSLWGCALPAPPSRPASRPAAPPFDDVRRVAVVVTGESRRVDPGRIGSKPDSGKAVVTARPVIDVVREALAVEIGKNGHALVTERGDVVLATAAQS